MHCAPAPALIRPAVMPRALALSLACLLPALPGLADAPVFVIDRTQLPFDLSAGAPGNSPARQSNSPNAAANSAASPANSASAYANSPDNPANHKRLIFTRDGDIVGYYAPNGSGTLNLFDASGRRIAYRPRGTKSLFSNSGEWCGTVAEAQGGGFAFGVTQSCGARFFD